MPARQVVSDTTCLYLLAADMEMEPISGYAFASWEQGYGDVHLIPDLATLRVAGWAVQTAIVLCDIVAGNADDARAGRAEGDPATRPTSPPSDRHGVRRPHIRIRLNV